MNNLLTTQFENKLKHGEISDQNILIYLLLSLIFLSLVYYIPTEMPENKIWSAVVIISPIIIMIIGTKISFDINTRGDNQDFFRRYIVLNYAIGVRVMIATFIIAAITGFVSGFTGIKLLGETPDWLIEFTGGMILEIIFYSWIITSFRRINKNPIGKPEFLMSKSDEVFEQY